MTLNLKLQITVESHVSQLISVFCFFEDIILRNPNYPEYKSQNLFFKKIALFKSNNAP